MTAADTMVLKDGTTFNGQLIEFDGNIYRFLHEDGVIRIPRVADVQSFRVDRHVSGRVTSPTEFNATTGEASVTPADISRIETKLEEIRMLVEGMGIHLDDRLNQLLATFSSETAKTQQRLYDLNPLSRVTIQNDRQTRVGRDVAVSGTVRNDSGSVLQGVRIKGELLDANGWAVSTIDYNLPQTLGPRDSANFTIKFPNAPNQFASYRLTPYVESRPAAQDTGSYFPPQPGPSNR